MFEKNVLSYEKSGTIGECPICKKKLIVNTIDTPIRKSIDVYCVQCKKTEFYSGVLKQKNEP